MSALDELTFRERGSDGGDGALVLFHGRGADENDLYPLLDMFDPERRLAGVCPRGPLSLPPGGAHWYSVMQVGYPDPATFHPTYSLVTAWLDEWLASKDVTPDRTVLAGFSQGCVMTYSLGLGRARPRPAGLIGLSGFIPTVEEFEIDLNGLDGYPVAIGHGIYDPVIEVAWGRDANQRLSAAGADITYRESPMDHTIDPAFIPTLATWLTKVLP